MNWRLAESLVQMRSELMTAYPTRDRTSDGSIGDEKHAARTSDHNPWVKDSNGQPVVTAIDVDRDISATFRSRDLAEFYRLRRDARIKYVISNGQMFASYANEQRKAWEWGKYTGPNGHFEHMHISVINNQKLYDSRSIWGVALTKGNTAPVPQPAPTPVVPVIVPATTITPAAVGGSPLLMIGSAGPDVGYLQRMLGIRDDKDFGRGTRDAVKAFQRKAGLDDSGVMDAATWIVLRA